MPSPLRKSAVFYLNGKRHEIGPDQAGQMLADYLRYVRGLTGTKIVCAEGDCGACSVLRLFPAKKRKNVYLPINSCITTLAQMDGSSLVTVDVLAGETHARATGDGHLSWKPMRILHPGIRGSAHRTGGK